MSRDRMELSFVNSKGLELNLGDSKPLVFLNASGMDTMKVQAQFTKAPYQVGKTFLYNDVNERTITINAALISDSEEEQEQFRRSILNVLNPLLDIGMTIKGVSSSKYADVQVIDTPKFKVEDYRKFNSILEFSFSVTVPEGFLSDLQETYVGLTQVIPLLEFPFEVNYGGYFEVGTLNKGAVTFVNDGDAPTPFVLEIRGNVKNPKLINKTTGEFIEVKVPLLHGEKLFVNTSFSNKEVILERNDGTRENAFHYINLDSVFFQLDIGENAIEFDAEAGNDTANVMIYYKKKWSGV